VLNDLLGTSPALAAVRDEPLARLTGNRIKEAEALATVAWASLWARNLDAAVRFSREALDVAEPAGPRCAGRAYYTIGFARAVTGVLEKSHVAIEKATEISTAAGDAVHRSRSLSTVACCEIGPAMRTGSVRLCLPVLNPDSSYWLKFRYSIRMFAGLGELALARGDFAAARSHSAECLALATRTGSRKNLVKSWRLASEIARAERDWTQQRVS
jgi:hypothetical protein